MAPAQHPRVRDAGVTLVEVLVVIALIGVLTAVAGLAIGRANPGSTAQSEATLLVARLNRAADEALLTATPVAFVWTADSYQFQTLGGAGWTDHPVPLLGQTHRFGNAVGLVGDTAAEGRYVVGPDLRAAGMAPLVLQLARSGAAPVSVRFDGVLAEVTP